MNGTEVAMTFWWSLWVGGDGSGPPPDSSPLYLAFPEKRDWVFVHHRCEPGFKVMPFVSSTTGGGASFCGPDSSPVGMTSPSCNFVLVCLLAPTCGLSRGRVYNTPNTQQIVNKYLLSKQSFSRC